MTRRDDARLSWRQRLGDFVLASGRSGDGSRQTTAAIRRVQDLEPRRKDELRGVTQTA
ncbi:hypothetical protein FHS96_005868 [Sphingomonas zeicaulis]|uniref:hypothetical protein n=1 Tax=Sphingomonas zeicaulis TaxID=1632740 RepID=UPI003D2305F5